MRSKICDENLAAEAKLAASVNDRSGIGVHYMDAYIKPMNVTLENGFKVTCKRRGLKVTLAVGDRKGEGLMRRLEVSRDPRVMLRAALNEAARGGGFGLAFEDGGIFVEGLQA